MYMKLASDLSMLNFKEFIGFSVSIATSLMCVNFTGMMIVIVNKLLAIVINIINEIIKKQKGHRERVGKSGKGYFPIIWGKNPRLKAGAGFELGSPRLESSALAIEPPVPINSQLINQVHQLH